MERSVPCRLVRARTSDGLSLQGLAFETPIPDSDVAVLHIHGLAGNFYENVFVSTIADALVTRGIHMYSVSTRGRDYEADFARLGPTSEDEVRIGSAHELLDESALDIAGWMDGMAECGIRRVVLQGHSLGTLKVAGYLAKTGDARVVGCVLLSPADMIGIQRERLGTMARWLELLAVAQGMVDLGQGGTYMPADAFYCQVTAASYLDKYANPDWDVFPIEQTLREGAADWRVLQALTVPALVLYGTVNEAVVGGRVREACRVLSAIGGNFSCHTICDADHAYRGKEQELGLAVGEWTQSLTK